MISHLRSLVALASLGVGTLAVPALAHVGLEAPEAARGKSYKAVLKVPHRCEGSPTHTVRVEIPEGFIGAKLTTGYVAKEIEAGALDFKVVQVCDKGDLARNEIPQGGADPHSLKAPLAVLRIAAADDHGGDHGGHDHQHGGEAGTATIGALKIEGGWTRATAEGAKVAAGYLTISNPGATPDTLVSVETAIAGNAEIHEMTTSDDGVMRMRRLPDGLEIPAGGSVELKPGGAHLMFLDLKEPLKEGASVAVKLIFKSGAQGEVSLPVKALGGDGQKDHDHSHH